tara:strand:+ start:313 stop:495 length:183 start_codon:yes stop_codon:yes gene_type:complete
MKNIKLQLTDDAHLRIKELVFTSRLAGADGPLTTAWAKVLKSIDEEKNFVALDTKKERAK